MPEQKNVALNLPNSIANIESELPPLDVAVLPLDTISSSNIPVLVSCTMLFFRRWCIAGDNYIQLQQPTAYDKFG